MVSKLEICRNRTVCAVLATGVVVSLTALTGGIAPALAAPGGPGGPGAPSTTVAPAPRAEAPAEAETEAPAAKPTAADIPTAPAAPTVPQTAAPVAPEPAATAEAPVQTRAPEPATSAPEPLTPTRQAPTATSAVPSATPAPVPSATTVPVPSATREAPSSTTTSATAPTPATTATQNRPATDSPSPSSSAAATPATTSGPATPSSSAPTSSVGDTTGPSAPDSASPGSSASESPSSESSSSESPREARSSESSSATSSGSSTNPAAERVIEKVAPQTLEAPDADVQIAQAAKIVEEKPAAAPRQEIDDISRVLDVRSRDDRNNRQPFGPNFQQDRDRDQVRLAGDNRWDRNVRQWRPDWVQYDEYYRPVLSNPYRDPVRIVYIYQNLPRVVNIPPLARIVLEVAQYAAYSFTAVVQNTVQQVANVAVGSFFGGGYFPGVGLPLPPPPPPLLNYANVPVQVRYSDATYEPFRVNKIVDVGDDRQYGERKVLLDGVTPAWGQWRQTPSGERSFEVHKTQQFPGLDDPQEAPLPGDYQLRLAAEESSSGMNKRDVYLIAVAVACGALSIGAVVLAVFIGRRRRPMH